MLDTFVSTEDIAGGVSQRLAMFLGHKSSQVVGMLFQEGLIFEHVANSLGNGHILPCLESILSVLYGGIELIFR